METTILHNIEWHRYANENTCVVQDIHVCVYKNSVEHSSISTIYEIALAKWHKRNIRNSIWHVSVVWNDSSAYIS